MKKLIVLLTFLSAVVLTTVGCLVPKLPKGFDEQTIYDAGVVVIDQLNSRDYEGVETKVRDDLKADINAESIQEFFDTILDQYGPYKSLNSYTVYGASDAAFPDEDFGSVSIIVVHEGKKLTYEITFDIDMMIVGLYIYQSI
jgi:hypothetical protein